MNTRHLFVSVAALALLGAVGCEKNDGNATEQSVYGSSLYDQNKLPYMQGAPQPKVPAKPQETAAAKPASPADHGHQLYLQMACNTCHTLDGSRGLAPTFKGVYGRTETLSDGSRVKVDDAYIKESVLNPTAKVVMGFPPVMPSFAGRLQPQDINDIIAFLKTVK